MANAAGAKSRVSTKGQIVLPKAIRDRRKSGAADRAHRRRRQTACFSRPRRFSRRRRSKTLAGMLRDKSRASRVVSIEDMDEAVLAEARRRHLHKLR